jgi:hypothetical protein
MNPVNVCSSGNLVLANPRNGLAIFAGTDLEPGGGRRAEVTIANLGALPTALRLSETSVSNEFPSGRLFLEIKEFYGAAGKRIFLGEIGTVPKDGLDLSGFRGGESRTYRFTLLLRNGTLNSAGERSARAIYRWNADSV